MSDDPTDQLSAEEAAEVAGVEPAQLRAMVDQGLLVPIEPGASDLSFRRSDVLAVRHTGG